MLTSLTLLLALNTAHADLDSTNLADKLNQQNGQVGNCHNLRLSDQDHVYSLSVFVQDRTWDIAFGDVQLVLMKEGGDQNALDRRVARIPNGQFLMVFRESAGAVSQILFAQHLDDGHPTYQDICK